MADLTPENYWPLGSTVQKTITSLEDTDHYRHFGLISVNPVNGHTVIFYRKGDSHVNSQGVLKIRHSNKGGVSWGIEADICSEIGYDLRNLAGGYDSNGRLFVFYVKCSIDNEPGYSTPYFLNMCYRYSDNDGVTWVPDLLYAPYELPHQSVGENNNVFSPYGHIVDVGNNILYQTWHGGLKDNGLPSYYRLYLYMSTDGGSTFNEIKYVNNDLQKWGEASMVNIGGGCFLLLARKNDNYLEYNHFIQFKSEDNCETWIEQGTTIFEDPPPAPPPTRYAAPPWLSFINYEGVGIVACYFTNRFTKELKVIFGLAKDLLEDVDGNLNWNDNTKKVLDNYLSGSDDRSGYQSFFLPLNQYKGIGIVFKEVSEDIAYPVIVFTEIEGMTNVLVSLGF
jgi:hypothetical protein